MTQFRMSTPLPAAPPDYDHYLDIPRHAEEMLERAWEEFLDNHADLYPNDPDTWDEFDEWLEEQEGEVAW